ncbi:MAG: MetQ/NlpA family ABC transporter substrate-binding protein [Ruminiclostridium sp.]
MKRQRFRRNFAFILAIITVMFALSACSQKPKAAQDDKVIKFAVCNLKAYEETTKVLAQEVEKLGYKLEYTFLADDTQINEAVESGEYFANYHQHTPYMNQFNKTHNAHLVAAFKVFTDRAGLFSKKYKSLKDLLDGARITIPNDAGNNFRTFVMLADEGLIKLKDGIDPINITQNDIVENPKKLKFIEVDYTMLAKSLEEADAGFLYATVAAEIGLEFGKDALVGERQDLQAADIIAVREENKDSEKIKILEKAYKTDTVKKALKDTFDGKEVLLPAW